jgi:hypothetical protein
MKREILLLLKLKDRRGVTIIVVAISLLMLLSFIALAIDIGYGMVVRNELQNISDGASLAATRRLGFIYETMSYEAQQNYVADPAPLIAIAKDVGSKNQAGKMNITINDADVIIGMWNPQTKMVGPNPKTGQWLDQPDAVRVITRRDGAANGPITTFFARIFGKDTLDVSADATAALTGLKEAKPGEPGLPVGVSKYWFDTNTCGNEITFGPTPTSCAGWNNYDKWPASDAKIRKTLEDMLNGTYTPPGAEAEGTDFVFIGGKLSQQTFQALENLFIDRKTKDGDGNNDIWTTMVAVYDLDCGQNPTGWIKIVGFAIFEMKVVGSAPDKKLEGTLICNLVKASRGSGGEYGTKGSIPGLVE